MNQPTAEKQQKVTVNGVTLKVATSGAGPPVLLLHGFPNSHQLWDGVSPSLAGAGYMTIAYDQRGYGDSEAPENVAAYKISTIVSDAVELLKALGVCEKVRVVGHDWGAVIAWMLAINHPDLVENLTVISVGHPTAYAQAGLEQKLKSWYVGLFLLPGIAEWALKRQDFRALRKMAAHTPGVQSWTEELSRPGRLTAGFNWYRANIGDLFLAKTAHCQVPTLGIYGPDIALTEEQMVNSRHYVDATWRYERFSGCGHWIPLDKPYKLAAILIDWFAQKGQGSANTV